MATGRLGASSLTGGTNTTVYTVPTGYYSIFNVAFCNTQSSSVTIRLALTADTGAPPVPSANEWLEYGTTVVPGGVFERAGLVAEAGKKIVAYASASTAATAGQNVTVNVYGIETSTS